MSRSKPVIALTGPDGLIGTRVVELLSNEIAFIPLNNKAMDITNREQVFSVINNHEFDVLLHLAAYTDVDGAEQNKDLVTNVNVHGTQNIFDAVHEKKAGLIYMSTGFVFDGEHPPFYEDSVPNPLSHYGKTKLQGEEIVKEHGAIVRIDFPYGGHVSHKKDFVESIVSGLKDHIALKGVEDQIMTPTYIDDIVFALLHLMNNYSSGIYHVVGADSMSGYDIIKTIGDVYDLDTSHVEKISYDEFYAGRAVRPKKNIVKSNNNNFYRMNTFAQGLQILQSRTKSGS